MSGWKQLAWSRLGWIEHWVGKGTHHPPPSPIPGKNSPRHSEIWSKCGGSDWNQMPYHTWPLGIPHSTHATGSGDGSSKSVTDQISLDCMWFCCWSFQQKYRQCEGSLWSKHYLVEFVKSLKLKEVCIYIWILTLEQMWEPEGLSPRLMDLTWQGLNTCLY